MNTQPTEKVDHGEAVDVHSIFSTIQGEGPFSGRPAVFIRMAGCNLQCPGCDTEYTQGRMRMSAYSIAEEAHAMACKQGPRLAVITGGEPFRQPHALFALIMALLHRQFLVQVETNGSMKAQEEDTLVAMCVSRRVTVVCSPKLHRVHSTIERLVLVSGGAYKYVLHADSVMSDGLPGKALDNPIAGECVARPPEGFSRANIYLQPMDCGDEQQNNKNLAAVVSSCLTHGYTLCLQTHKIAGVA